MYILKNEISILRIEEDEKLQIHKLFPTRENTYAKFTENYETFPER